MEHGKFTAWGLKKRQSLVQPQLEKQKLTMSDYRTVLSVDFRVADKFSKQVHKYGIMDKDQNLVCLQNTPNSVLCEILMRFPRTGSLSLWFENFLQWNPTLPQYFCPQYFFAYIFQFFLNGRACTDIHGTSPKQNIERPGKIIRKVTRQCGEMFMTCPIFKAGDSITSGMQWQLCYWWYSLPRNTEKWKELICRGAGNLWEHTSIPHFEL